MGSSSVYTTSGDTDGNTFDKKMFAEDLKRRLASHRNTFVIDEDDWVWVTQDEADGNQSPGGPEKRTKIVSTAALKLLLDYCESEWPGMSIEQYAAGVFHSREPAPNETLFDLLPDVRSRLSADRLGLGHIYK